MVKRVLFVDHVDRILGGAEINLIELITEAATPTAHAWSTHCACAPAGPLAAALAPIPGVQRHDYHAATGFNQVRLVGQSGFIRRAWKGFQAARAAAAELSHILIQVRPTHVISCTNKDHFALSRCRSAGLIPCYWWVNDLLTSEFFSWPARRAFFKLARSRATGLIAVSGAVAAALNAGGAPRNQIHPISNGIPLHRYARQSPGSLRSVPGLEQGPLVGIIGRFTPWKGQHLAIDIAHQTLPWKVRPRFVLIGRAFNEDASYEASLRQRVRDLGLESTVYFLPFQSNVAAALSDLDLLLHTSTKPEPFGRVIIEAMAVGTPVIAAREGGVTEILTHNETGLLVPPGSIADYTAAIQDLLATPEKRNRLAMAARRQVEERFSIQRVLSEFDKMLS